MFQRAKNWWADPFDADMGATNWFLFIGLLIVASILWRLILGHILEGIR